MSFRDLSLFPYPARLKPVASPRSIFGVLAANLPRRLAETEKSIMVSSKARMWIGFRLGIPGDCSFSHGGARYALVLCAVCLCRRWNLPDRRRLRESAGSLVTLSSLGVTSCYYFSKSTG